MPLQHRAWLPKLFKVFASLFLSCPFHRRITMTRPLEEALFQHFIHQKLEIAYKCEFLLLKAYCHPQSSFFAETPRNIQDYGEPFKEAMWLDLVKERLTERVYTVAWFLRDMRLIFRNHQMFYKASDFGQIGLDLEAEFEKDLKKMFTVHEAR
uniref:SP110 nuclear body protein n=2 Tax=Sus scrofa TaxID=9823 RepID=A0A8D0WMU0_PIG